MNYPQREFRGRLLRIHGNVQGVGFRWTARSIASTYNIGGYVKNKSDGSVEVYAVATDREITEFVDELKRRFHVERVELVSDELAQASVPFEIRR